MNKKISVILLLAGSGERSGLGYNKVFYPINNQPLFSYPLQAITSFPQLATLYVVFNSADEANINPYLADYAEVVMVKGGQTRAESVRNALKLVTTAKVIIVDGARIFLTTADLEKISQALEEFPAATFYTSVSDTLKEVDGSSIITLNRQKLRAISTPQGFCQVTYPLLLSPSLPDEAIVDEICLVEKTYPIGFLANDHFNIKVTTPADLELVNQLLAPKAQKIGHSYDFHPFTNARSLRLGGIDFPDYPGLAGHSDADVVYHTVSEAIIGALGAGDLGTHFPDHDVQYLNIDSAYFVSQAAKMLANNAYVIGNIDLIVYLEKPKLVEYKQQMAQNIAQLLNVSSSCINVKATTLEKCGLIGNGEGIAAECVALIKQK